MAIEITGKLKPKGTSGFSLVDAEDIEYKGGRLPDFLFHCVTQEDYNLLVENNLIKPDVPYLIIDNYTYEED